MPHPDAPFARRPVSQAMVCWCVLPQVDNDQELFMVYRKEVTPPPRARDGAEHAPAEYEGGYEGYEGGAAGDEP